MQTKITQLLDSKNIQYKLLPHENPVFTCEEAAKERGVVLNEMVKCILLRDKKKKYFLACLLSDKRLNPQKVRDIMGCARLSFASKEEITEVLGYELGAIPPLLLKTDVSVVFDNAIMKKEKVNISSGDPKAGIELKSSDLVLLIKPRFGNISE